MLTIHSQQKSVEGIFGVYSFDIVSFDIGSGVDSEICKPLALNIKPNYLFTEKIKTFRSSEKPVILGGGSAGVELALSVIAWKKHFNNVGNVTLISSSPLLSSYGKAANKKINTIAKEKGLTVYENHYIKEFQQGKLITDQIVNIDFSYLLPLTGPSASKLFKQSGLQTDQSGFMLVNDFLQSVSYPFIFGAGDCVTIEEYKTLPKNGVYAVRQGPVLWENIKRKVHGNALLSFKPQKKFISILSTGDKSALFTYGQINIKGNFAWRLKNKIDTHFIRKHQRY
ncbi:FAD-dependent oxidoreductase [Metabacillus indicus]|uniref:FAD-dependent oxidoreductase n=1 Tax=Metabacillus indicus TaxID=246786 RepID=UPI003CF817C2